MKPRARTPAVPLNTYEMCSPPTPMLADGCREATAGPAFPPAASRAQHMDDAADDRRSFIRRAPGWPFGKNGSMPDQASSESRNP